MKAGVIDCVGDMNNMVGMNDVVMDVLILWIQMWCQVNDGHSDLAK